MGHASEFGENVRNQAEQHIAAIHQLDRELDALIYPVTTAALKAITHRFLEATFGYDATEAATRTQLLEDAFDIPADKELDDDPEIAPESLKFGLFDKLPEEYLAFYGEEAFGEWIEPFLASVLKGHLEDDASYEHLEDCGEYPMRFCPALIMNRYFDDKLCCERQPVEKQTEYRVYPREFVYMNMTILNLLHKFGVYSSKEADEIADGYMEWLEDTSEPLEYDADLFDYRA